MEISDHGIYNLVVVARCNNNLRTGVQRFHIMAVQVIENGLQRFTDVILAVSSAVS